MTNQLHTILIVEDEPSLRLSLHDHLQFEGYRVLSAERGDIGLEMAQNEQPDLILLDVMLPGMDGFAFCRELKQTHPDCSVIFLSARDQTIDVVRGLELGADDYLRKPFDMSECLARIRSRLRQKTSSTPDPVTYSFGDMSFDFQKLEASKAGEALTLTTREFRLMQLFVERKGDVLSRDEILNQVWGYDVFPTTRTVDNYILRLRKCIEEEPSSPVWLVSVRGAGYRFTG